MAHFKCGDLYFFHPPAQNPILSASRRVRGSSGCTSRPSMPPPQAPLADSLRVQAPPACSGAALADITIGVIAGDDVINISENNQNKTTVGGTVGGDAKAGDTVTLTVNGKPFTGTVAADLTFSINVPGSDLAADPDRVIDASVTTTDAAGNPASATDTEGYSVNLSAPSVLVDILDPALNIFRKVEAMTYNRT